VGLPAGQAELILADANHFRNLGADAIQLARRLGLGIIASRPHVLRGYLMWQEKAMPQDPVRMFQLDLFRGDAQAYQDALARYEMARPILRQERTLAQHSQRTGLSYWRLRKL
jgi:hypothetical protein